MDCGDLKWNPQLSAASHSAFAGVLAGLVFAGIVVLLSDQSADAKRTRQRSRAAVLFVGALLLLTLDAFLFGVVAGEVDCSIAWLETMLASGLLGLGGLAIFVGIAWLFDAYGSSDDHVPGLGAFIPYTVALIVASHLQVTAASMLLDMKRLHKGSVPELLDWAVTGYLWLVGAYFGWELVKRSVRRLAARFIRIAKWRRVLARMVPKILKRAVKRMSSSPDRSAKLAAHLSVVYALVVATCSSIVFDLPQAEAKVSPNMIVTSSLLGLILPSLAILAHLRVLPHARRDSTQ